MRKYSYRQVACVTDKRFCGHPNPLNEHCAEVLSLAVMKLQDNQMIKNVITTERGNKIKTVFEYF